MKIEDPSTSKPYKTDHHDHLSKDQKAESDWETKMVPKTGANPIGQSTSMDSGEKRDVSGCEDTSVEKHQELPRSAS